MENQVIIALYYILTFYSRIDESNRNYYYDFILISSIKWLWVIGHSNRLKYVEIRLISLVFQVGYPLLCLMFSVSQSVSPSTTFTKAKVPYLLDIVIIFISTYINIVCCRHINVQISLSLALRILIKKQIINLSTYISQIAFCIL